MIILNEIVEFISTAVQGISSETGGIIGSCFGEAIDEVVMDIPEPSAKSMCSYTPNVDFFNSEIEKWQSRGVNFRGIFHTHFAGVATLSRMDEHYIHAIMYAMPKNVKCLFFPIFVLPDKRIVGYKAERTADEVRILPDEVYIQNR